MKTSDLIILGGVALLALAGRTTASSTQPKTVETQAVELKAPTSTVFAEDEKPAQFAQDTYYHTTAGIEPVASAVTLDSVRALVEKLYTMGGKSIEQRTAVSNDLLSAYYQLSSGDKQQVFQPWDNENAYSFHNMIRAATQRGLALDKYIQSYNYGAAASNLQLSGY